MPRPHANPASAPEKALNAKPAILRAAIEEFAEQGFSGARMDAIAKATGVNIALLFYYFKSKDLLYKAALEEIFGNWRTRVLATLQGPQSPKEKLLAYINMYFDLAQSESPSSLRLVYQEIMRQGVSSSPHLTKLAQKYIKPIHHALRQIVRKGIAAGEIYPLDPEHFVYSMIGMMNFYFVSSSVIRILSSHDPWSKKGIEIRRREVTKFIQLALTKPNCGEE
ncbi:MAG TPA: TetR/AcrR family transcriptional regulator [Terriglobales bacterium]|jgi:TetR/AcrR family transcriptional regulator|nr:TetR/AcrR family transcriptional regulator [Terriglobales bacterium]